MNSISIIPLGTVSPYSKDNSNCPGFLIKYKEHKILLDCGSGITRLLNFPIDLKDLTVIITHYHKDHFGDIGSIQYASFIYNKLGLLDNKINIYLPEEDVDYNKKSILSNNESYSKYIDIKDNLKINISDLDVSFEDNKSHYINSYMVKLENKDFKIVYTSDIGTTNFDSLVNFCENSDLLICESTYFNKNDSTDKKHMSAHDSAMLAKLSNTKKLLLTHFWPEEDKNLYLEEAKTVFDNVELAEENKTLTLKK